MMSISLVLELPPSPLGFALPPDGPLVICRRMNESDLSSEQWSGVHARSGWLKLSRTKPMRFATGTRILSANVRTGADALAQTLAVGDTPRF